MQARPREWLTVRELQTAFLAGRLCLTEPQVLLLRSLVVAFSKTYEALYSSKEDLLDIKVSRDGYVLWCLMCGFREMIVLT